MRLTRNTLRQMILREMRAQNGQDMPALRSTSGVQGQPHRIQLLRREKAIIDVVLDILGKPGLETMTAAEIEALVDDELAGIGTVDGLNYRTLMDPVIDKLEELGFDGSGVDIVGTERIVRR